MEITEVRIKLMEDSDDRLQAFCSITFDDCFVVRDLKIIEGANGPFVAMPSRKLTSHCPQCGCKNHLRSGYCNQCGGRLKDDRASRDHDGRAKLYADIAHPINSECREMIQNRVIAEYRNEQGRSKEPGYVSRYDDEYDDAARVGAAGPLRDAAPDGCDDAAVADSATERAQVQPAEVEPRPPHKARAQATSPPASQTASRRNDDFGAGIF